ncbi:phenylalanyl-tRNA synthetase, alpha subunit [Halovenus aranensis]|uniref:Phenylalanine--tRNA ligase alpha subunit n=1 Tax=Halovenus aranensis TaxID=890420 RepID=A0A1G8XEC2_9EURY|nr:phenylalanine--tRNA ligase subunit alpha [Halovenus aranensis]SDJ88295.1 phenylalanyl-tRNA synthetase, alpha subunit [Halovenus aranensis]
MQLPETQVAVLRAADAQSQRDVTDIASEVGEQPQAVARAAFELEERGLVDLGERTEAEVTLTGEGEDYAADGLPELALYEAALAAGAAEEPVSLGRLIGEAGLDGDAVDIALANFARKGYGTVDSGDVTVDADADLESDAELQALETLAAGDAVDDEAVLDQLDRRGLIDRDERTVRSVTLTGDGVTALMEGVEAAETVDRLTPELLTSGEWETVEFTDYNVEADADDIEPGRKHALREMADRVKDVLVGMGFQEMQGPTVDADFWIHDCLFMPQDHPARTHWDRFAIENPGKIDDVPDDIVDRVKTAHSDGVGEDGEGYHSPWDEDFARQLALRGHTTSLTARHLAGEALGDLEPPQRFFSVEKAYRNDELDATHLLEFFQIEGWVMAEELSVRDLMGTFTEFYEQFGITDLEFKPTYNPYTEPSFELFGRHPETGELIEIGNSGIFRPEMLEPLEVDCDVMAWGLALERLMMLATGAEDIRDVHGTLVDLEYLRTEEVIY